MPLFGVLWLVCALSASTATAEEYRRVPSGQHGAAGGGGKAVGPVPDAYREYSEGLTSKEADFRASLTAGYRIDELDWNIAGTAAGTSPNIISELTWKDLESRQLRGSIDYTQLEGMLRGLHVDGFAYRGWIYSGVNQDSDYAGDNRTDEFSRSYEDSDDGDILGYGAAIGYAFEFRKNQDLTRARVIPLLGYAQYIQELTMTNGVQVIPPSGPFGGLNSSYETEWKGPFIGADLELLFSRKHLVHLRGTYHLADYYAKANWNLRTDFQHPKSYEHEADGKGYTMLLEYAYMFYPHLALNLQGSYESFTAEDGVTRFFLSDGTTSIQKLNEVNWDALSFSGGLSYHF